MTEPWIKIDVDPAVGCQSDARDCPVYHALDDAGLLINSVDGCGIEWHDREEETTIPYFVQDWISTFDLCDTDANGEPVDLPAPISFLIHRETREIKPCS